MPYERPTLTALIEQAQADVASSVGLFTLLRFSPERALAVAEAGLAQGLYGYLDWIALQAVPYTATGEFLEAWAALIGVLRKDASLASSTAASFTGAPGAILPSGTPVARTADGVQYLTTASGTVSAGGAVSVPIQAVDAGAIGNAASGAILTLGAAVTGVNSTGTLAAALTGGADIETDDAFRLRMLEAYQAPPQGGSETDYIEWAKQVPGVTRAWVAGNGAGAGTVVVYVMFDDAQAAYSGFPQGADGVATDEIRATPATGDQLTVANHIYPLRPVTALVYVVSPVASPVDFTIGDVNDAALRPAIADALAAMFVAKAQVAGTLYPSDCAAALDSVSGLTRYSMPAPATSITAAAGHLHTLGTITWA